MIAPCISPPWGAGIAVRIASYTDCQARALGEGGYLALAGSWSTSLVPGLLAIAIALIGYRIIVGGQLRLADGIGWTTRIGIALALLASWPLFQTLFFRVALDAPVELTETVLPAMGQPSQDIQTRVQSAYDTVRLGSAPTSAGGAVFDPTLKDQRFQFQEPAPRMATLFVLGTVGLPGALKLAIGFLLAIGPLAFLTMIVAGRDGLVVGWIKCLVGSALALVGTMILGAIELTAVETELARLQLFRTASVAGGVDPQAIMAVIGTFFFGTMLCILFGIFTARSIRFRMPLIGDVANALAPANVSRYERTSSVERSASAPRWIRNEPPQIVNRAGQGGAGGGLGGVRGSGGAFAAPSYSAASGSRSISNTTITQSGAGSTASRTGSARRGLGRKTRASARRDNQ